MNHTSCPQCIVDVKEAITQGFETEIYFFQTGILCLPLVNLVFDFEHIKVHEVKTCNTCEKSTYLLIVNDVIKGRTVDYRKNYSS